MPSASTPSPVRNQPGLDETHARLAVEAAGLGLWEWDIENDLFTVNQGLAALLGRPELAASPFPTHVLTEITHPDDRQLVQEALQACLDSGDGAFLVEHRIHRPDGEERWLWISASVVERTDTRDACKILGVVQDRTEHKQTKLALEDEKRRTDKALEGSLTAIWEWDPVENLTRWSPRLAEMLGLPAGDLGGNGDPLTKAIHPDDIEIITDGIERHLNDGTPYDVEFRMFHADGRELIVRSRGQAETDVDGTVLRMAGSLVDVTEERAAKDAALKAGIRAQLAVEAAELGTWELDLRTSIATMDQRLCDLLGRPELANIPISSSQMFEFTAPEDVDRVRAEFTSLIKGELEFVHNEHRVLRPDGSRTWILAHVSVAERAANGHSVRLIGVAQDLSEQKETERALRDAKERAETANEAKSNFLATMSHEIRTPLNGMLGVAQLLGLSQLDDKQRRYVDTLQSSGRTLASVIEDILDISRIEAGKLHLTPERVDPEAWLGETLATFSALAAEKSLTLKSRISDDASKPRYFDPRRTAQIVGNLVSNAIKFTDAGSVEISLTAPLSGVLRVEVSDTGPGVSKDQQARVFERFSQADMSASREHGGSGLGLAIVKELVELAGGQLGLESEPGQGSTFWFEIPARSSSSQDHKVLSPAARCGLNTFRVLIVEDNEVNRTTLQDMLAQHGMQAVAVDSGEAALERLREDAFDLILLDLHMPGMGGFQTLQEIRSNPAYPNTVPVYLVSADATPSARDEAGALGAQGFFTKPVDMTALIDEVLCVSDRRKSS